MQSELGPVDALGVTGSPAGATRARGHAVPRGTPPTPSFCEGPSSDTLAATRGPTTTPLTSAC